MAQFDKIVKRIEGLPTLPTVVARVNELVDDASASAGDINDVLSRDLALSSKILKLVNSAFYGFPRRISSITHAVVILGFNTIRNIALSSFVIDAFQTKDLPFGHREFWLHSLGTAMATSTLAHRRGQRATEDAFMCGLLHDVGKLVMFQHLREDFARVLARAETEDALLHEAEDEMLGIDHAHVGSLLMDHWKLPTTMVEVIRCHHAPERAGEAKELAALVHTGNLLAQSLLIGSGGNRRVAPIAPEAREALALAPEDMPALLEAIGEELHKADAYLELI